MGKGHSKEKKKRGADFVIQGEKDSNATSGDLSMENNKPSNEQDNSDNNNGNLSEAILPPPPPTIQDPKFREESENDFPEMPAATAETPNDPDLELAMLATEGANLDDILFQTTYKYRRFKEDFPQKSTLHFRMQLEGIMTRKFEVEERMTKVRAQRDQDKHKATLATLGSTLETMKKQLQSITEQEEGQKQRIARHMEALAISSKQQITVQHPGAWPKPHMPTYCPGDAGSLSNVPLDAFHATSMLTFLGNKEFWTHLVIQARHASRCFHTGAWDSSKALVLRASHDPSNAISVSPEFLRDFVYGWSRVYCDTITVFVGSEAVIEFFATPEFWHFISMHYEDYVSKLLESYGPLLRFDGLVKRNRSGHGFRMTVELWSCLVTQWEIEYCSAAVL